VGGGAVCGWVRCNGRVPVRTCTRTRVGGVVRARYMITADG